MGQAGQWLARWHECSGRSAITPAALRNGGLQDLARTPILLFMIAYTWGDLNALYADWQPPPQAAQADDGQPPAERDETSAQEATWDRKHRVYEAFFRAIAWGKYERDHEAHPVIIKAARTLHEALDARSLLGAASSPPSPGQGDERTAERDRLTHAMLWLMGRVAWRARCLQQQPKPKALTRSQVERLLEEELDLDDRKLTEVARDGLLLAMQADLSESSRPILFGHQSFREFLVARCWSDLLHVIVDPQTPADQRRRLIDTLRDGRLRDEDDRSFDFLRARLRQWTEAEQHHLHVWALAEFENDAIEKQPATLRSDSRRDFRTTALALASVTAPSGGLVLRDGSLLRSLLASYWIADETAQIWAPRLQARGMSVLLASLERANLSGANLRHALLTSKGHAIALAQGAIVDESTRIDRGHAGEE